MLIESFSSTKSPSDSADYWTYDIHVSGDGYIEKDEGGLANAVMRKQGVFVRENNPNYTAVFDSSDERVRGMYPVPDNLPEGTFGAATTALSLSASAVGASSLSLSYVLGTATLASKMGDILLEDSVNNSTHDWQKIDSGGFKRGGYHMRFSVREYPGSPISLEVYSRWGGVVHDWELEFDNGFQSIRTLDADLADL